MPDIVSLVKVLLLPPMVFLLLAVVGLLCHRKRAGLPLSTVCLGLFLLCSLPAVENAIALFWENQPVLQQESLQRFSPQALVVIGGGLERGSSEFGGEVTVKTGTLRRLRYAAKLARETHLPVLVSGGRSLRKVKVSEAEVMTEILVDEFGIPVAWQEAESRNTAENARFSRRILQQHGIDRIVLVTEAYHMRRAVSEFRKAGFSVLPAPTAFIGSDHCCSSWIDWLPSVRALEQGYLFGYESIGTLRYQLW